MKIHLYIGMIGWMMFCITGCSEKEVLLPHDGYIYFNTEVSSRGELITNMQEKSFGVTAYQYTGEWNTVKVQAVPNVFEDHGQEVYWTTDNNGNSFHTYDNLKPWDATSKYTFFGYYPYDRVSISERETEGVPYIDYTLPDNVSDMADVMTASLFDTDNSNSNAVGLTFKHRLVAMDIQARNFLDEGTDVTINSLSITFDNLQYNQVRLPLDASLEITSTIVNGWNGRPTYSILSSPVTIESTNTTSGTNAATSLSANSSLIFIPQTENLRGTINLKYQIDGGDEISFAPSFDTGKSMLAGRKFYLLINFSKTSVSIAIVDSGEWSDNNIEIEFE